jgi:hypothetical protein
MTINLFNFPSKIQAMLGGDVYTIAQEANMAPISIMYAKETKQGLTQVWQNRNNMQSFLRDVQAGTFKNLANASTSATCFRFFPSATVQKFLPSAVKALDVSLLETGFGKGLVSKLGGSATFAKTATGATANITGSTAARVAGKSLARIPLLSVIVGAAFEVPDIIDAFKHSPGEGMKQLGRSAIKVGCTTAGAAIGAALGSLIPIPGLGTLLGGAIGGWLGSKLGGVLANGIFGKSVKDKMADGDYTKQIMQSYSNLNFGNIGSGRSIYDGFGNNNANNGGVNVDATLAYVNNGLKSLGY